MMLFISRLEYSNLFSEMDLFLRGVIYVSSLLEKYDINHIG